MQTRLYTFTLEPRAPLLFPSLEGDTSGAQTLDFIPGSAVRGAVAAALAARNAPQSEFDTLVLGGAVRYLNAYPLADGHRALPASLSLREKRDKSAVQDLSATQPPPPDTESSEFKKRLKGYLWPAADGTLRNRIPDKTTRLHHQRARDKGTAQNLYAYTSVDPHQRFVACIAVDGDDLAACDHLKNEVAAALRIEITLGRARATGYGGEVRVLSPWSGPLTREIDGHPRALGHDLAPDGEAQILLLSDYIGRDLTTGQIDPTAILTGLVDALGGPEAVSVSPAAWGTRLAGGFNRTWGLPLKQALALRAGSVLTLKAKASIPLSALLAIEAAGLGERRAEGYGRIAFLTPATAGPHALAKPRQERPQASTPRGAPPPFVLELQDRMLIDAVQEHILTITAAAAAESRGLPSRSLLGRLRVPLRGTPRHALNTIADWLDTSPGATSPLARPAREALERCTIPLDGRPWPLATVLRFLSDPDRGEPERWLHIETLAGSAHLVSPQSAQARIRQQPEQRAALRTAFARALLDALARASLTADGSAGPEPADQPDTDTEPGAGDGDSST